jgi:adenine-specific DNA-methyltransferase
MDTVSIHVHERIDPKSIIQQVHKNSINSYAHGYQHSLFEQPFDHRPVRDEVSFYQHKNAWANRLIAGDSLLVMNSLLEKEGMAEQVQMVYMDPPYGISYGSNFQPFVDQRDVTDGKDADLNTEPEMLKAFRDTWELGIHSYLSYLRDRVMLSHQMLSESGSFFMQISEDNLHIVRMVLDEIFGKNNFVSQIFFKTTGGFATDKISRVGDYLLWYAKDAKKIKYRQLFEDYQPQIGEVGYNWILFPDGTSRGLTAAEKKDHSLIPKDGKIYKATSIKSQGGSNTPQDFEYLDKVYSPGPNHHWKTSIAGLQNLGKANRIHVAANND